ncbi:hypothetical protein [Flavobacterium gilvum]|uniref:Uncharacterized protein n=1 Tax=Flavobacterium gilvum TaxID=1492737 RepID=A0AAC9I722_9FLAO|nr:hypothetical protein [Flavobacterium gilvum]AOW10935.1 hypothetical protein EM308_16385 [Flavobacterium gilvum]KFC60675.1 hypothetical protein FEM08_05510 [Flavobacterium gilvum]
MSISDLKLELITQIVAIDDVILLNKIKEAIISNNPNFLVSEPTMTYEKIRVFSKEEQRRINIALKQVENGDYISDEEAQIEIEKWFEEQE